MSIAESRAGSSSASGLVTADSRPRAVQTMVVGLSGGRQNACVAAVIQGRLIAVCEQERVTRTRSVKLQPGELPREALDAVLKSTGLGGGEVRIFAAAESGVDLPTNFPLARLPHHYAHAATAALTSGFDTAVVLVCDRHSDPP